jgi:tetratricopeptide (TPR) repeat protein
LTGLRLSGRLLLAALLLAAAGCATWRGPRGGRDPEVRSLSPVPDIPDVHATAAEGILDAFFAANRISLEPQQLSDILPGGIVLGRIDAAALRRAARRNKRIAAVIPADATNLWHALGRNLPLLLYLPADRPDAPPVSLAMPVRWDRRAGLVGLLDGNGILRDMPEDRFFALREPLKQAALCLVPPSGLDDLPLTARGRRLLLADFRYDQGDYRRAEALYRDLPPPEDGEDGTGDVLSLAGRADSLVQRGKPARAIPLYERALALEPDNPRLLNNLAYAMMRNRTDLLAALRHARKAIRLEPGNPLFLETAGSLELCLGDWEAAARTLEHAWARARRHPPEVQIAIQDQLVRAWFGAGRKDLAWQVAEHRFNAFPDYAMPRDIAFEFPALYRRSAAHPAPAP